MKKTFVVTITLNYDGVTNEEELKKAVFDEAQSWVESGSFGTDLYCSMGNGDLTTYKVAIKMKE